MFYKYKSEIASRVYNKEISYEEGLQLIAKHEEKLEKKRKYKKGEIITNPKEILKNNIVWAFDKPYCTSWLWGMQFHYVMSMLENGRIYQAINKEQENGARK